MAMFVKCVWMCERVLRSPVNSACGVVMLHGVG